MEQPDKDLKDFIHILFPDGDHSQLEYDPEQLSYLARLGSQGLDSLNGEVARLNEEVAIVEHQTRDMASQNYQIFVQSAQTTNQIKKSLEVGNEQLVQQLKGETFPRTKSEISKFSEISCKGFVAGQKSVDLILSNQDSISKVLEMPWLVRRCLADEKLPYAIKVLQVAQDMVKSVADPPIVLTKTCDEVMELKSEIQHALLSKLSSGTIGLSECLQTVSLLRSFFPDDKSLRFRFLQSRMKDVQFDQARTWVFDTLTQHRAAFGGDSNHYLSTWVALQIQRVLVDMQKQMEVGESIDTLMTQATYFGESFARVGADLRGLIVPIFTDYIVKRVQQGLYQAEVKFCRHLRSFNLSAIAQFANPDSANLDLPPPHDLNPPKQLISHMPLAQYLNDVLSLLNFVSKCPLTQAMPSLVQKLNSSLAKTGEELEKWGESEWLTWELREQSEFSRMKRYFEHLLVPHLDKVFRVIFPPKNISTITGLGVGNCSNMMHIKYTSLTSNNSINNFSTPTSNVEAVMVPTPT